jgi:hypothetical protein
MSLSFHVLFCSAVKGLFASLDGQQMFDDVNMHETLFTMDRGYNTSNLANVTRQANARLLGTRKRELNFPYTFDTRRKSAYQRMLQEKGSFGAYFATTTQA